MITNNSKAPSCTCPSGDGSLVHPCPAHPASVKQAGGDERAAFEAWATHLPLDRQYLRPDLYMTPTQWAWDAWQARAALVQPSPAPTLRAAIDVANDRFEVPVAKWGTDLAGEKERPEVVAFIHERTGTIANADMVRAMEEGSVPSGYTGGLMTVTQHDRMALERWQYFRRKMRQMRDLMRGMRDRLNAAQARVAELEMILRELNTSGLMQFSTADEEKAVRAALSGAQAQHSVPDGLRELLEMLVVSDLRKIRYAGAWRREAHNRASSILALLAAAPGKDVPQAWLDVQAERRRQVEVEGYHGFRDSHYTNYELSKAARAYIEVSWHALSRGLPCKQPESWPWRDGFKWSDGRTMLVKACALGLAEIERLDRAAATQGGPRDA